MSSNRLPILAAEIRRAHADVQEAARAAAEHAITAGHALIEAKELLNHGEWLPWLREHCALAERTAQLYMKIAKSGLESATVADLGLKAAAKAFSGPYPFYDPFNDGAEDQRREWLVFVLFLCRRYSRSVQGAWDHSYWLARRDFETPSEWLGAEGEKWRRIWGIGPQDDVEPQWLAFLEQHRKRAVDEIEAELRAIADAEPEIPPQAAPPHPAAAPLDASGYATADFNRTTSPVPPSIRPMTWVAQRPAASTRCCQYSARS
jgi:Protein of unknown function (DUF3102)